MFDLLIIKIIFLEVNYVFIIFFLNSPLLSCDICLNYFSIFFDTSSAIDMETWVTKIVRFSSSYFIHKSQDIFVFSYLFKCMIIKIV